MKKKIISISAISLGVVVAAALIAFGLLQVIRQKNVVETGNVLGIEWYDENETEFTISTAEELLEFAKLSDFYNFKDQVVKLDADIVWNEGDAKEWAENPPAKKWNSISKFAGTFDGQGHTISGVYMKGYEAQVAMFINPDYKCTVQNFKLVNSYIETAGFSGTASIVAGGGGKFVGIYSDAIINHKGENVAGIGSTITKQSTFEECQFDGVITTNNRDCGGIIDEINGGRVNMRHCLFSGVINSSYDFGGTRTGGLVGFVYNTGAAIIQDSLVSGKINCDKTVYTGSVIGVGYVGTQTTVSDTFATTGSYDVTVATANGTWTGTPLGIKDEKLIGVKAYQWTSLDFDKYWSAVDGGTPVLKRFGGKGLNLTGVTKSFDTSWYTSGGVSFEIKTLEQFYGLYYVSAKDKFTDKIIKLGADIVMNTGKASDWEKNAPANEWIAIPTFEGTFDGQGHTISGIYSRGASTYQGIFGIARENSVIKNFSIKNSLYYNENTSLAAAGSVCGDSYGIIENIYSNAIIISHGPQVGGITGRQNDNDSNGKVDCMTIRNCWFDGSVSLKGDKTMEAGGIVGRAVQGDLVMEHCLNTGTVSSEATGTGLHIGGLIGRGNSKTIKVSDCLTTGKIICNYNVCVGSTFGRLPNKESVVTIENVYASKEAYKDVIGTSSPAQQIGGVIQLPEAWFIGNNAYKYTELDFPNYWALVKNDTPVLQSFATSDPSTKGLVKAVDTSWYNKDATEYIIKTPAQFFGFAFKSMQDNFQGKTVKLGANIDVASLGVDWIPIGPRTKVFRGTFDGQGYTISGVTHKSDSQDIGLFCSIDNMAMLKNFRLVDSTFEYYSEAANEKEVKIWMGSVCADMRGDMENIYSNALVISNGSRVGGIAGMPNGSKDSTGNLTTSTMKNCWFDGEVRLVGNYARYAGGIAGQSMQGTIELIHCLNTGKVSNERPDAGEFLGGIMGSEQNGGQTILIEDCLNVGTVTGKNWNMIGAIVGGTSTGSGVYNIVNTYALDTSCVNPKGATVLANHYKGTLNSAAVSMTQDELSGYEPFRWTELDANHWVPIANGTPELKYFSTGMSMAGIEKMYDTSWYSADKKEFTITTAKQLYGLAILSGKNTFKGQTFKLGADIDMSAYDRWISIGNLAKPFEGTFDGQDHVISNMSQKTATMYAGLIGYTKMATVKNVIIKDSTFESTVSGTSAFIGGIIGGGNGTLHDSYSNAKVVSTGIGVGGLIGRSTGFEISGCWYDGEIEVDYTGADSAMVGGLLGTGATETTKTTIDNCAFTGNIDVAFTTTNDGTKNGSEEKPDQTNWRARVGSVVGADGKAEVEIKNVIAQGTQKVVWRQKVNGNPAQGIVNGSGILGYKENTNSKYSENVYDAVTGSMYIEDSNKTIAISGNMAESNLIGVEGYRYTDLDFDEYWAARKDEVPGIKKFVESPLSVANVVKPDTSWYDDSEEEFHLKDEADFFGFTKLVASGKSFSGKVVYLDEDMELNPIENDTVANWMAGTETPDNPWMMIGNPNNAFRGTFDGQMHTVAGAYTKQTGQYNGLFGYVLGATIKNLKIVDSYFESTPELNSFIGGVVGGGNGKVLNCYTSATIYSTGVINGGIVGRSTGFTIDGCWFDGDMTVNYKGTESMSTGGILGAGYTSPTTITNCLVTGNLDLTFVATNKDQGTWRGRIGSIAGADNNIKMTISDCIAEGKFEVTWKHNSETSSTKPEQMVDVFNPIGYKQNASSSFASHVYTLMESKLYVEDKGWDKTMTTNTAKADILGMDGFYNTVLDFENYWAARTGKIPALKKFVPKAEQLDVPLDFVRHDTSWYSESATKYYIDSAEAMYGFMDLMVGGNVFSGKTIYLTNDIKLNVVKEGTVDKWIAGTETPTNKWTPAGYDARASHFVGTFDGQGYTISGLYVKTDLDHAGLFGAVGAEGVVKDFSLVDSYVYTSATSTGHNLKGYAYTGSVVGQLAGTIEDVYSNAYVSSPAPRIGGIVGVANCRSEVAADKYVNIKRCWFDGKLDLKYDSTVSADSAALAGGIAGHVMQKRINFEDCLFTGTIKSNAPTGRGAHIGGMFGQNQNAATIILKNCLSAGVIDITNYSCAGSVVGYAKKTTSGSTVTSTYTITNLYAVDKMWKNNPTATSPVIGNNALGVQTPGAQVALENIKGDKAATTLKGFDFKNTWVVREGKVPALKSIVNAANRVKPDVFWYDGKSTTYTISNANQLLGLAKLTEDGIQFEGITIKLDKDIKFNEVTEGTVAAWAAGTDVPINKWTPIGPAGGNQSFQGTFDGQGHTISGLYMTREATFGGLFGVAGSESEIKNVRLTDSYLSSTAANLGSFIGWGSGKISNVYSNATLYSTSRVIGGIAALTKQMTITNCWYDGTIYENYKGSDNSTTGGIVGGLADAGTTKIENCLFSGKIKIDFISTNKDQGTWGASIGGILGKDNKLAATINNTISAGEIELTWHHNDETGSTTPSGVVRVNSCVGYNETGNVTTDGSTYSATSVKIYIEDADKTLTPTAAATGKEFAATTIAKNTLLGADGSTLTKLTFSETGWMKREGKLPIPAVLEDMK